MTSSVNSFADDRDLESSASSSGCTAVTLNQFVCFAAAGHGFEPLAGRRSTALICPPDAPGFGEIADLPLCHRPVYRLWQLGAYAVSQAVELGTERGWEPWA